MRIEKKSNNCFRCLLTAKDLEDRQIRLDELAYGSAKARKLFEDLVWEAEEHYGVELQGEPLVIEAIPLENEGLALEFAVMEDSEELDFRYSEFTLAGGTRDTDAEALGADDLLRDRSGDGMDDEYERRVQERLELPEIEEGPEEVLMYMNGEDAGDDPADAGDDPADEDGDPADGEEGISFLKEPELLEPEAMSGAEMANSIREQIEEGLRKLFPNARVESVDMTTVRISEDEEMDEFQKKLMRAFVDKIREKSDAEEEEDEDTEGFSFDGIPDEPPAKDTDGPRKHGRRGRPGRQSRENLRVYRFASLEDVLAGSANVAFFAGESTLFHGREGYSLVLRQGSSELRDFNRVCNVLSEYGAGRNATPASAAYLAEHDQCIFRGDAVQRLAQIETS